MNAVPLWVEAIVAVLLVVSGIFTLMGALGLLRLKDFFLRMHAPALGFTLGAWCVALALIAYFSALEAREVIHSWLIVVFLAITVPVTTLLLARAALFRKRQAGDDDVPPSLTKRTDQ